MTDYATGGLVSYDGLYNPNNIHPFTRDCIYPQPVWGTPPGPDYYWNPWSGAWELRNPGLTWLDTTTNIEPMARAEVIEFTHEFDGGDSKSIRHVWYNSNTERLTIQFLRGGGTNDLGGIYSYDGVDWDLYSDFKDAPSYGRFFHAEFAPAGDDKWPGVKHDELRVKFQVVEDNESREVIADLDALKPEKITRGKGKAFTLEFTYSGRGKMEVRANDAHDAIQTFLDYMKAEGFTVTNVTTEL